MKATMRVEESMSVAFARQPTLCNTIRFLIVRGYPLTLAVATCALRRAD